MGLDGPTSWHANLESELKGICWLGAENGSLWLDVMMQNLKKIGGGGGGRGVVPAMWRCC